MNAFSICDRITRWVDDQIEKEDPLGADEWGRHVTMTPLQTPQGEAIVWTVLITVRSPYLGEDALGRVLKFAANVPPEPAVRSGVAQAMEALRRDLQARSTQGFAVGNGHSQQGLPPGLLGRRPQ